MLLRSTPASAPPCSRPPSWTPRATPLGNADVKGAKISYRDVHDRILAVTEYNNGQKITTTYDYDAIGQIKTVKDAKGNLITITYDKLGPPG